MEMHLNSVLQGKGASGSHGGGQEKQAYRAMEPEGVGWKVM